jgi:hypothetical protein
MNVKTECFMRSHPEAAPAENEQAGAPRKVRIMKE